MFFFRLCRLPDYYKEAVEVRQNGRRIAPISQVIRSTNLSSLTDLTNHSTRSTHFLDPPIRFLDLPIYSLADHSFLGALRTSILDSIAKIPISV